MDRHLSILCNRTIREGLAMADIDIPSVASKIYELLEPLEPTIRKRAIKAALTMLGDDDLDTEPEKRPSKQSENPNRTTIFNSFTQKVQLWMKSNSITESDLEHTFHAENGKVQLIAGELPGKTGKERSINAYLLTGLTQFLETGEAKFDDKVARDVCKEHGCFDQGNHAYNLKGKGNLIGGTKDSGWTLTTPGLKAGAELIKSMVVT
jgi:hypothetical protein